MPKIEVFYRPAWTSMDHTKMTFEYFQIKKLLLQTVRARKVYEKNPWEYIFKLGVSAAASEFCQWVQGGIDVYIPHRKYQVKPHSSPWFSAACAAAIVHRNPVFSFVPKG